MGRKATVGARAGHSQFAREVTAYLDKVREDSGLASVRQVSALTVGQRSNSWWAEIFNGTKILTTNDVHYIATELLGINPYEFIANARRHASGDDVPKVTFGNVGAFAEDEYEVTPGGPKSDLALAANERRKKVDTPHTE